MFNKHRYKFLVIFTLFGQIFYILAIKLENGQNLKNAIAKNAIDAILTYNKNWTENYECSIELESIKNGIETNEEWVTTSEYDV